MSMPTIEQNTLDPLAGVARMEQRPLLTIDEISAVLDTAVQQGASDIVLKHLTPPCAKINGAWHRMEGLPGPSIVEMQEVLKSTIGDEKYAEFEKSREADFRLATELVSFRVNAGVQRGGPFMTFRPIPTDPPTLDDLNLLQPDIVIPILKRLAELPRGLVLITGATGSGKSTTLAAMINHINLHFKKHIITIEDPIEFQHVDKESIIEQREVGADTDNFNRALRGVLRQTPDVILVGEMRDAETIQAAITAAETGHLVISTVHTNSAPECVSRILDVMPGDKLNQVRAQLAATLKGVVTQQLVPKADGEGRQVALELMLVTNQIQSSIKNADKQAGLTQYYDIMASEDNDSILMDRQLAEAMVQGLVTPESAESRAMTLERYQEYTKQASRRPGQTGAKANRWTT